MSLINAATAFKQAQIANRSNWLNHAMAIISNNIHQASQQGLRCLELEIQSLYQGAENLFEISEMLTLLNRKLINSGYEVVVTPDCRIFVKW